ncbi:alpha mannosidase-like protein [Gymnopilus junonius]|uniref:alpha-1,2-Mannosidase n=1 Tax=Gymnopilus junonius TaxID=109634 RepID=A0A9P5P2X3_GYMJU|nr:alpha mannosidase-like protein [Gymnopilus junonius]
MQWARYWLECLLIVLVLAVNGFHWFHATDASSPLVNASTWTTQRKLAAREKTRELWYHGFESYMTFAFPLDELTPLSCSGQGPDWANPANIASNDVAGNFSLTLIDVLDTFVVLDDRQGFEKAVKNVIDWVSFDVNTKPQVFETTIRVLGGLLSGHIFANQTGQPFHLPWYRGELLSMAHDLGERLLPAFSTPTGLPYARINLRHGLVKGETLETCTAGAGSLILEFATLSRLTGDDRFEKAAYRAFFAIWNRKSDIDLVGNTINTWTGKWTHPETTGIGAGVDSFYEYALKWYIMSGEYYFRKSNQTIHVFEGELEFLDVWDDAYAAVMRYSRTKDGHWYRTVHMHTGDPAYHTIDSLSAFWPGLQVLAGDVQNAIRLHMMYYNLWRQHSGLPEVYDTNYKTATSLQYPLRPGKIYVILFEQGCDFALEFIESTWYLYRATRDPFYLDVGERVLFDLTTRAKVACGLSGIQDLRTNKRDDRMESFALSETLKYLYLLFDEENPLHSDESNYVFTTEGHILTLGRDHMRSPAPARKRMRNVEAHQCPVYVPSIAGSDHRGGSSGLVQGIRSRPDVDYSRYLVGVSPSSTEEQYWSPDGWCDKPNVEPYTYEFILSPHGKPVAEDLSPSLVKVGILADGYIIHNVTGIRTQIVQRLDGQGYDIRKLGHYSVRPGQLVYINDSSIFPSGTDNNMSQDELLRRDAEVFLRIFIPQTDPIQQVKAFPLNSQAVDVSITAYAAKFGADLSSYALPQKSDQTIAMRNSEGLAIHRDAENFHGCDPYQKSFSNSVLLVHRGHCTFLEKLVHARDALAVGIIIVSNEEMGINPTANADELADVGDLSNVGIVLLTKTIGQALEEMVVASKNCKHSRSWYLWRIPVEQEEEQPKDPNRILYINGHALINTRLLV